VSGCVPLRREFKEGYRPRMNLIKNKNENMLTWYCTQMETRSSKSFVFIRSEFRLSGIAEHFNYWHQIVLLA
jgi:hypothetical protein